MPDFYQNARGVHCNRDSDCPNSTCHFRWRTCTTRYIHLYRTIFIHSSSDQAEDYLSCILSKASTPQRNWFEDKFGVSLSNANAVSTILKSMYNVEPDCLWSNDLQGMPWARMRSYYVTGDVATGIFYNQFVVGNDLAFPFPNSPYFVREKYNRMFKQVIITNGIAPPLTEPSGNCQKTSICNHDNTLCNFGYFATEEYYKWNVTRCQEDCGEGEMACMLCQ